MTEVEKYFLDKCIRKVTNRVWAVDSDHKRQLYRHPDLDNMSKEAFDNGEKYFYCEPANPNNPYGKQIKCEPKYIYECCFELTPEEYEELKNKCK